MYMYGSGCAIRCAKQSPRLSVLMGVYNIKTPDVFSQAVKSVLTQTMCDFEFIICDDGSSNQTRSLLLALAKLDSRIKLIHSAKNEGLASAVVSRRRVETGLPVKMQTTCLVRTVSKSSFCFWSGIRTLLSWEPMPLYGMNRGVGGVGFSPNILNQGISSLLCRSSMVP